MYLQIISRVEGTLKTLGLEASEAKTGEGQYNISKDETEVLIDVWEDNDRIFFQAMSPVTTLEGKSGDDLKMLLEENHGLVEAAFTIINNEIFIKETIECSAFFNQERAISTITRIAYYSEVYKSKLA
jgi:hypothetical protein